MRRKSTRPLLLVVLLPAILAVPLVALLARQNFSNLDRQVDRAILRDARDAVKKYYYDPKFHGADIDALYSSYDEKIKASDSNHQALAMVAAFLEKLNDSHTFFVPPSRVDHVEYGYKMQMIGDQCFITRTRPGTDAEAKLHPGDQVVAREGYAPSRSNLSMLEYYFQSISPREFSELDVKDPGGQEQKLHVNATVVEDRSQLSVTDVLLESARYDEVFKDYTAESSNLMIWKVSRFDQNEDEITHFFRMARKHPALVLDLRGNPGGSTDTLESMLGHVFDHDVKIADRISRKETKPLTAKSRGGEVFTGKLVVLIDSDSASAAELFARVVQLEGRGTVIGDRSSGKVMEAKVYPYSQGQQALTLYEFEITDADLVMKDGKSLEGSGVTPDEVALPTAADLAAGRDTALSRAAELAGAKLDPGEAGKLFPYEWAPLSDL
jgi:carboxyl-terminal processing protease